MQEQVKHQTLAGYIVKVGSVGAAVLAMPLRAKIVHSGSAYLNPPLGNLDQFVVPFSIAVVAIWGMFPWLIERRKTAGIAALGSGVVFLVAFGAYFVFVSHYIVRIDVPDKAILVSIGSERTPWAQKTFGDKSDVVMLKERGQSEEDIRMLWTDRSIMHARAELLGSFLAIGAAFMFTVGSFVRISALRHTKV
ncbi:MAG TPA: hypothetical protein VME68_04635 [Acidobacteriaceae bacterium]|nr:hypothetical protein [Acidobacteriaceae bacterium]